MYNSLWNNQQYTNPYYATFNQNYRAFQTPQVQQQPVQQPQVQDTPFNDIKFVTADEARAFIVMPNSKVILIDRDKSVFYIKSADMAGKSSLEGYKYTKMEEGLAEQKRGDFDPKAFVKTEELNKFLLKDEVKNFATNDDIKKILDQIDTLQRQVQINEIFRGEKSDGRK